MMDYTVNVDGATLDMKQNGKTLNFVRLTTIK